MKLHGIWKSGITILLLSFALGSCKQSGTNSKTTGTAGPVIPSDRPAVLATIAAAGGEYSSDSEKSGSKSPVYYVDRVEFSENGTGVATTLLLGKDQWQVSFNDRTGPIYPEVGPVTVSPDGRHYVYKAKVGSSWCMVVDGTQTTSCYDDITSATYSADSNHLIVEYFQQGRYFLKVDNRVTTGSRSIYRTPRFYDDYKRLIFIDTIEKMDSGRLVACNADLTAIQPIRNNVNDFYISTDRRMMAAIELLDSSKSRVLRYDLLNLSNATNGPEFDQVSFAGFSQSGDDFFYFGKRGNVYYGVLNGREEKLPEGLEPVWVAINRPDKSVGVLVKNGQSVFLYRMLRESGRQRHDTVDAADWLVYSADGRQAAFAARKGDNQFVVVNGSKGPNFDRVVSLMFSPDGRYLVYRARKAGKRFVVVADSSGRTVRQHPSYDHVHDIKFLKDGKAVAYGVKDGRILAWKVEPL